MSAPVPSLHGTNPTPSQRCNFARRAPTGGDSAPTPLRGEVNKRWIPLMQEICRFVSPRIDKHWTCYFIFHVVWNQKNWTSSYKFATNCLNVLLIKSSRGMLPTRGLPSRDMQLRPFHLTKSRGDGQSIYILNFANSAETLQISFGPNSGHSSISLGVSESRITWDRNASCQPCAAIANFPSTVVELQASCQWRYGAARPCGRGSRGVFLRSPYCSPKKREASKEYTHIQNINYTHPKKTTATIFVIKKHVDAWIVMFDESSHSMHHSRVMFSIGFTSCPLESWNDWEWLGSPQDLIPGRQPQTGSQSHWECFWKKSPKSPSTKPPQVLILACSLGGSCWKLISPPKKKHRKMNFAQQKHLHRA